MVEANFRLAREAPIGSVFGTTHERVLRENELPLQWLV